MAGPTLPGSIDRAILLSVNRTSGDHLDRGEIASCAPAPHPEGSNRRPEGSDRRKHDPERGAPQLRSAHGDLAAVLLDDVAHDGQPQARALAVRLGGEERLEDA